MYNGLRHFFLVWFVGGRELVQFADHTLAEQPLHDFVVGPFGDVFRQPSLTFGFLQ